MNANATAALTIDLGSGNNLENSASGPIEATAAGGLTIASGTISNAGTLLAGNGSTLTFQSGVVNSNNSGGVLSGCTWEADGNGSTLAVTGGAVTVDAAAIILSGAGSLFRAGDGSTFTNLEASLGSIAAGGALKLLAGRQYTTSKSIADSGTVQLAGGTLTAATLTVGAGAHLTGFGTVVTTNDTIADAGTIEANGGTLATAGVLSGAGALKTDAGATVKLTGAGSTIGSAVNNGTITLGASAGLDVTIAVDAASSGVFQLNAASVLEVAADQGVVDKISLLGASELIIDAAAKFGLNAGTPAYTGPLLQNFGVGDQILLKDLAPAGLTAVYSATTGLLQVSNGSTNVATLAFDKASLGAGTFHIGDDGHGHALLTMIPNVHWVAGSGNFNTATGWNPQHVPGATDNVVIDAAGTYTVTATTNETMNTLAVAADAKLVVNAGTFTVSNGSGPGGLAGTIVVDVGAALALAGSVTNTGTIAGAGQVGNGGSLSLINAAGAVINANQAAALVLNSTGKVSNAGLIEATDTAVGNGGLVVQGTTIDNAGGRVAASGARTHVDLAGCTLIGGVLASSGGGVIQTAAGANGVLDGLDHGALTNNGLVRVTDSTSLELTGSIVNAGTVNVAASTAGNTDLRIGAPVVTLSGGGTVLLSSNAGNRIIGTAAANRLVNSDNTIAGGGQLGAGALAFSNGGTVNANAAVGLTIDLGSQAGQNLAGGLIEATAAGGLTIAGGTIGNAGTMLAANSRTLTFQSGAVNTNNSGGVLKGGTWEAVGNNSALRVTGGAVAHDNATIILSGAGSVFSAGDGSIFTNLRTSLAGVSPFGTLELDAGAAFTAANGISDFGMIRLGGGTLTLPRLALGAGGHVSGFGTIADTRYALSNGGTIEANGGTLAVAGAIDPASSGVFRLDASSLLEIAANQGAQDKMSFVGTGGELIIDAAAKFGLNVGSAAYTGPLVQNFGTGDEILLKNVAPAGLTPVYDTATGILQLSNGSANAASLMFDKATLGTGAFHLGDDGQGHALLTHS